MRVRKKQGAGAHARARCDPTDARKHCQHCRVALVPAGGHVLMLLVKRRVSREGTGKQCSAFVPSHAPMKMCSPQPLLFECVRRTCGSAALYSRPPSPPHTRAHAHTHTLSLHARSHQQSHLHLAPTVRQGKFLLPPPPFKFFGRTCPPTHAHKQTRRRCAKTEGGGVEDRM
jgi:hypothetical protein